MNKPNHQASSSKLLTQLNGIQTYLKELKLSNPASVQKLMEKAYKAAIEGLKKSIAEIEVQSKTSIKKKASAKTMNCC